MAGMEAAAVALAFVVVVGAGTGLVVAHGEGRLGVVGK